MNAVPRCPLRRIAPLLAVATMLAASPLDAGTIVRIGTSIGDFSIDLRDETAPVTVGNFLNYVNRNDYDGTYFHRVVEDFVAQGGAYRFQLFVGPVDVPTDPPIVNEFGASNTRGTVAMAKLDGDPDSATNQWFVNLADNSANLDSNNGGFTVFGDVLGDGMAVLDAIDELPRMMLGIKAPDTPYFTEEYRNPLDFVYMNAEVVDRFSTAPHVFEAARGLLITSARIDGDEVVSANFSIVPSETGVVLELNPHSVIPRRDFDGVATYSSEDNRLRIPAVELHSNGAVTTVNNVVLVLTGSDPIRFTLESPAP